MDSFSYLSTIILLFPIIYLQVSSGTHITRAAAVDEVNNLQNLIDLGKPLFFNRLRTDGAGATVMNMIYAASYAAHRGWSYAGAISNSPTGELTPKHFVNVSDAITFIFGRNMVFFEQFHVYSSILNATRVLKVEHVHRISAGMRMSLEDIQPSMTKEGSVWPSDVIILDTKLMHTIEDILPSTLVSMDGERGLATYNMSDLSSIMSPTFLEDLRTRNAPMLSGAKIKCCVFKDGGPTVAMHLRRGDVWPNDTERYTPNNYYVAVAKRIRNVFPKADMHAFTALERRYRIRDFNDLKNEGINLHFEEKMPLTRAWAHLITADIFVMAKSSSSQVPAVLNSRCVVYHPNRFAGKLPHWRTAAELSDEFIRSCFQST